VNAVYRELVERIRGEVPDLDHVAQRSLQSWSRVQRVSNEQDVYLDSVALNLHSFYSLFSNYLLSLFPRRLLSRHVDAHQVAVDVHNDAKAKHAQPGAGVGRDALLD
jgi:hypothetical protein